MRTEALLKALTHQLQITCGDLHTAALNCGVSTHFVVQWCKDDREVANTIDEAQRIGYMGLEAEAIRRAVQGVDKNVYYKGEVVGVETQYSDGLLQTVMKARIPAYKSDGEGGNHFNGPTQINIMPRADNYEEWLKMKDLTLQRRLEPPVHPDDITPAEFISVENPFEGIDL